MAKNRVSVHLDLDLARSLQFLFWGLVGFEVLLFVLDILISYVEIFGEAGGIDRITNLTREDSIGTWFSCLQAFFVSMAFLAAGLLQKSLGSPNWKRLSWFLIALFFFYVSVDDGAKIHERVGSMFDEVVVEAGGEDHPLAAFPTYYWHLLYMPIFFCMGLFIFGFLWVELGTNSLRVMLIAALGLYVVSQGMDVLERVDVVYEMIQNALGVSEYTVSHFSKISEELMEMVGTTFFLMMPLWYMADRVKQLNFDFR